MDRVKGKVAIVTGAAGPLDSGSEASCKDSVSWDFH